MIAWLIFIALGMRFSAIVYKGKLMEFVYINLPKKFGCAFCLGYNLGVPEGFIWGLLFTHLFPVNSLEISQFVSMFVP